MSIKFRKHLRIRHNRLVIKLSSLAVTNAEGGVNSKQITNIVNDIAKLKEKKKIEIILVCSGAVNAGKVGLKKFNRSEISHLQAASSIGQPILMEAFRKEFLKYDINISQVLLTHEDLKNKMRSHNVRSCLNSLLENKVIPIINENDSVSFDEITLGDNDQLSAMICEIMNADTLHMLTQADGLYDKDPSLEGAIRFPIIDYKDDFKEVKVLTKSSAGRGGMKTKLQAVRKLTPLGIDVIISSFSEKNPILRSIVEEEGSLFLGKPDVQNLKKKSWILTRVRNHAIISVDAGAKEALLKNASLLPIGVTAVTGKFNRGDSIQIKYKNTIIACGISEYSYAEIEKIKKQKSSSIIDILGYAPSKVVIHKDNLVLNEE